MAKAIKTTFVNVRKRVNESFEKQAGVIAYDHDNLYPYRIERLVNSSGTATACVNLLVSFLAGAGIKDKDKSKIKVNSEGTTLETLYRKVCESYAMYGGYAIHVSYNSLFEKVEYSFIDFKTVRLGEADDSDYSGKVILANWDTDKKPNKKKYRVFDKFNDDENILAYQIAKAGGIEKYKGQIYYFSPSSSHYPVPSYDSVAEDIYSDYLLKSFRKRNISTNFMATHMVEYPYKFETDNEREDEIKRWESMQGVEVAGKIMIVENPFLNENKSAVKVTRFENVNFDKEFELTSKQVKDSIMESFGQPPILLGVQVAGSLGQAKEIENAFLLYNQYTDFERKILTESLSKLLNIEGFEVEKLSFKAKTKSDILLEKSTEIIAVVKDVEMSVSTKRSVLKLVYKLDDSDISNLLKNELN